MEQELRAEFETKLDKVCMYIYTKTEYKEDYQIPMLKQNRIAGILNVDRCEVEGMGRYTYDISGLIPMKTLYGKRCMKKQDINRMVQGLIQSVEELQQHMLNPDCLLLQPEYIFCKNEEWYFCYLPENKESLRVSFHELTEYFVKTLDYEDTEGIFLAYELHKATLQEQYDLSAIMKEYAEHEEARKKEKEQQLLKKDCGNIFVLTEEEEREDDQTFSKVYQIREESGSYPVWKRVFRNLSGKCWGQWDDLILETDGQEENSTL